MTKITECVVNVCTEFPIVNPNNGGAGWFYAALSAGHNDSVFQEGLPKRDESPSIYKS